jgi:alpha-galactosidase
MVMSKCSPPSRCYAGISNSNPATWPVRVLTAIAAVLFPSLGLANTVWLSALDLKQVASGWSVAKADRSIINQPIRIGGNYFEKGLGTHSHSRFRVKLGGNAQRFLAQVGIADDLPNKGTVEFVVFGDRKEIIRRK